MLIDASVMGGGGGGALAAEPAVVAFRGRPNTLILGKPTCGYTDYLESFPLTAGGTLRLTTWNFADRTSKRYNGPIVPDELISDQWDMQMRAIEWLHRRQGSSMSGWHPARQRDGLSPATSDSSNA